jgi:hypothetical protein
MSANEKPAACYRDRDNGVRFIKAEHAIECNDSDCRGCKMCAETGHCSARKNCSWHIAEGQLTCGRCITAVRNDLQWIEALASLMLTEAMGAGVNSEAAMLAGPSADYATFSARRTIAKRWIFDHLPESRWEAAFTAYIADDDEHHPESVLTRWEAMIREDYDQRIDTQTTLSGAAGYLDRILHRFAHDDGQDFALLARELKKCRQHLESVLHNDDKPERGAPCPACHEAGRDKPPRLTRVYAERWEADDDSRDKWSCPRDKEHSWSEFDYRLRVADWHDAAKESA